MQTNLPNMEQWSDTDSEENPFVYPTQGAAEILSHPSESSPRAFGLAFCEPVQAKIPRQYRVRYDDDTLSVSTLRVVYTSAT